MRALNRNSMDLRSFLAEVYDSHETLNEAKRAFRRLYARKELEGVLRRLLAEGRIPICFLDSEIVELMHKALVVDPWEYSKGSLELTPIGYIALKMLDGLLSISLEDIYSPPGTIVIKGTRLFQNRIVRVYQRYLMECWSPSEYSRVALFTPCSKVKPVPRSFINLKIDAMLAKEGFNVDRYIVSEPLILIPYKYAYMFPAAHYDYPPPLLEPDEREIFVNMLAEILRVRVSRAYENIVYFLTKHHRKIFEDALEKAGVEGVYVPFNVYWLPKLRDVLRSLT
ncbi:MAG: hypothetical protein DRJ51_05455 [Thermoprotei archaeon]|nr:MAG: hypothetical protein DRJ51_05455 [Thermoprotei archaeon]